MFLRLVLTSCKFKLAASPSGVHSQHAFDTRSMRSLSIRRITLDKWRRGTSSTDSTSTRFSFRKRHRLEPLACSRRRPSQAAAAATRCTINSCCSLSSVVSCQHERKKRKFVLASQSLGRGQSSFPVLAVRIPRVSSIVYRFAGGGYNRRSIPRAEVRERPGPSSID